MILNALLLLLTVSDLLAACRLAEVIGMQHQLTPTKFSLPVFFASSSCTANFYLLTITKMRILLVALLSLLASSANAYKTGLMGYGQSWYDPPCAYACRAVIGNAPLDCPSMAHGSMGTNEHSHSGSPLAPCIATNSDFLRTLAYCLSTRCADVSPSKLESYWSGQATGDKTVSAEWTYGAALANVTAPPKRTYIAGDTLNYTALIANADY